MGRRIIHNPGDSTIKTIIEQKGFYLEDIAACLGLSCPTFNKYLRNSSMFRFKHIILLGIYLQLELIDLYNILESEYKPSKS